jgi:myosin-5
VKGLIIETASMSSDTFEGDLTDLHVLDENHILDYVCNRFQSNEIYTYSGSILISLNPWRQLSIYSEQHSKLYFRSALRENPPHCFAIADTAYRRMINDYADQSILVSGESGAGKTETAKFLLQHLAFCSSYDETKDLLAPVSPAPELTLSNGFAAHPQSNALEQRVLASNPILEAFGNARTVRNPNSSRYGKFIQLLFSDPSRLRSGALAGDRPTLPRVVGASISIFLLERSRVVHVAPGEGNFHIFGQLRSAAADARCPSPFSPAAAAAAVAGAGGEAAARMRRLLTALVATEGVRILGDAGAVEGLSVEDLAGFERTVAAMRGVGLEEAEVVGAMETVAVCGSLSPPSPSLPPSLTTPAHTNARAHTHPH